MTTSSLQDWFTLRKEVRSVPFSDVRGASRKILIALQVDRETLKPLQDQYDKFIQSLEKMDGLANIAAQNKEDSNRSKRIRDEYEKSRSSLHQLRDSIQVLNDQLPESIRN